MIAGHRDTQFRILWRVKIGEDISVEAGGRTFVYRVTDRRVVAPADTRSLDPTPTATLTLVTCYPFYYVGAASNASSYGPLWFRPLSGSRG